MLVMGTVRTMAGPLESELAGLIAAGEEIRLGGLTELESRRALAACLPPGFAMTVEDAAHIVQVAQGHPLYLVHGARALANGKPLSVFEGGVARVLRARLTDLPAQGREVLSAAAILGESFSARWAADLAGVPLDRAYRHLRLAVDAGLLTAHDDPERVAFAHPLVREAALSYLLPGEQRALQRAALELKRAAPQPPPPAELVAHAQGAGDLPVLADLARRAASQALRQGAFHEAGAFFDRAIEAIRLAGAAPEPGLLSEAARAWLAAGRATHAATLLWELARCLEARGDRLAAVEAKARSVRAHATPESASELEQDIAELEQLGPTAALAMALATWAHVQAGGKAAGGEAIYAASKRALALARTFNSPETLATALLAHGHIVANAVDFQRGCDLLEECLAVARTADAPREEHAAAINLVSLLSKAGQHGRAANLAREAAERALEHGAHRRAGQLLARLSEAECQRGNWEEAKRAAEDAVLLTDENDPQSARAARWALATLLLLRHSWD
ncbi:MAG: hypothetical protein ACRDHY_05840, partial [Anaerolineales bacterium]